MEKIREFGWIRKEKKKKRKNGFHFSPRSMEIEPSVFFGARRKVHLRDETFAEVREYGVFAKLQEVGFFLTWVISSLKTI